MVEVDVAADEVNQNTHSEPIAVPQRNEPFATGAEMNAFLIRLSQYKEAGYIPAGYGMLWNEWEDGMYLTIQVISVGRGAKQLEIGLPHAIWQSRSQRWVQALDIMNQIQNIRW